MFDFKKMRAALNKASKNSLLIGVGSLLNIIPVYGRPNPNIYYHPDMYLLKSDWKMIGNDFNNAIKKVK